VASVARARAQASRELGALDGCPGVLRLHEAADGYLARVRLPGGHVDARALDALAQVATLGSDIVELTSRAGLQVRGLAEEAGVELAQLLSDGGLLPSFTHERVRNIAAAPLAGRGPASIASIDAVVQALDLELCADPELAELPGRFLFAVDDGTGAVDSLRADVQLTAERDGGRHVDGELCVDGELRVGSERHVDAGHCVDGGRCVFRLWLDGFATSLAVAAGQAPAAALRAAHGFLELREESADGAWRVRELDGGAERLARHLGLQFLEQAPAVCAVAPVLAPARGPALVPARPLTPAHAACGRGLGLHIQRDGLFAVAVLPALARLDGVQLTRLAEIARWLGSGADSDACVRVSPWRTLTFVDVPASVASQLLAELQGMGLIGIDASGWSGLSACAGMGACAKAHADVRVAAAERALVRKPSDPSEHWSGCERRCGEPADAGVRVVAGKDGLTVSRGGRVVGCEHDVRTTAAALELLDRERVRA
jgi:precorrin-3B synthase